MPDLLIETPEGLGLRLRLAGAGTRAAAGLVDLLILVLVELIGGLILALSLGEAGVMIAAASTLLLLVLYPFVFLASWGGRTPGKALLGARVVDVSGGPASLRQLLLRSLFLPVELGLMLPLPLGLMVAAITPHRQRVGDLVAGTVVILDRQRPPASEPFPRETWSGLPKRQLPLVPAHAARFDLDDLADLRELLARTGLEVKARKRLRKHAAGAYATRLGVDAPEDSQEVFGFLRELFLFLRESRARLAR